MKKKTFLLTILVVYNLQRVTNKALVGGRREARLSFSLFTHTRAWTFVCILVLADPVNA